MQVKFTFTWKIKSNLSTSLGHLSILERYFSFVNDHLRCFQINYMNTTSRLCIKKQANNYLKIVLSPNGSVLPRCSFLSCSGTAPYTVKHIFCNLHCWETVGCFSFLSSSVAFILSAPCYYHELSDFKDQKMCPFVIKLFKLFKMCFPDYQAFCHVRISL